MGIPGKDTVPSVDLLGWFWQYSVVKILFLGDIVGKPGRQAVAA